MKTRWLIPPPLGPRALDQAKSDSVSVFLQLEILLACGVAKIRHLMAPVFLLAMMALLQVGCGGNAQEQHGDKNINGQSQHTPAKDEREPGDDRGDDTAQRQDSAATRHSGGRVDPRPKLKSTIRIPSETKYLEALSFSSDGRLLASGEVPGPIRIWDLGTGKPIGQKERSGNCTALVFSPNDELIAVAGLIHVVSIYKVDDFSLFGNAVYFSLGLVSVYDVAFSPDGRTMVTAGSDGNLSFWKTHKRFKRGDRVDGATVVSENILLRQRNLSALEEILAVEWRPGGSEVAYCAGKQILLVDGRTGNLRSKLEVPEGKVHSLAFSPTSNLLAAGCEGGVVKIWDFDAARWIGTLKGHTRVAEFVAFAGDQVVMTGSVDGTVRVWNVEDSESVFTIEKVSGSASAYCAKRRILAIGKDNTIQLWQFGWKGQIRK